VPDQYVFGRVRVLPDQRQVLVDGQPAALGARAFDVLLALVERRERLVSKSELLDLVWPGLVVEENNLQVHVSALRKLLGTPAIATVPGRGYRFTLASEDAPSPPAAATEPSPPSADKPRMARLPQRGVAMLGRDAELAELTRMLDQHALVTLVGPGGIGKTTLARCAAQARQDGCPDGVVWIELASLTDAQLIAGALAQALSLQLAPGDDAQAALARALRPLRLLLVIDNAEHLVESLAPLVEALLEATPFLRVLVTSQVPLRLRAEQVMRLEALAVPLDGSNATQAAGHGAVALFTERERAADRRFVLDDGNVRDVIEICRHLDGMPLALELAAARVPLLGAQGVAQRLDDRFRLLAGGSRSAPSRHQTLQAALDWSLALLPPAQQQVFRRLGVFAGGFTLGLAVEVLAADDLDEWGVIDVLASLVDHSLLNVGVGEPPRYALSETARAYAQSRSLAEPADHAVRARHAAALRRLFDASPSDWLQMSDAEWLARYEGELDNLRAALSWAVEHDTQTLVALVGAAAPLWHHLSLHTEARHWHERSEALLDSATPKPLAARWWRAAQWAWSGVSPERSRAAAEHAHALYRELGDEHGLYAQLTGLAGMWSEPSPEASAALDEAVALERTDWPARELAWGQRARADVARANGRLADSRAFRESELALRVAAGDQRGRFRATVHLVDLAVELGELAHAVAQAQALVAALRLQRSPATLHDALRSLIKALRAQGRVPDAEALVAEADGLALDAGMPAS
jgi:predicted ATPase/DNA-binding winged helix-turn-helix (wHTH) protein